MEIAVPKLGPRHSFVSCSRIVGMLLLLTLTAVLIHGYHTAIEDQEVYLAAINKHLDPAAYPFNARFFTEQNKMAVFVPAVAATVRLTHSVAWTFLLWHAVSVFLFLLGCWQLAEACFEDDRARWAGVALVTALLTMPIAGTALYLLDQHLHPRTVATCGNVFALVACLQKRWLRTAAWLLFGAAMHPLMALFGVSLVLFVAYPAKHPHVFQAATVLLPLHLLQRPSAAWKEAAQVRTYYFPLLWAWYEWLGLVAPVLLVWWFARIARRHKMTTLELLATRSVAFAVFQFAVGALMTIPPATQQLAALQPMRWLHIFYFVFLLISGGLIGQFLLREKVWRWLVLFLPISAAMFYAQRELYHNSDHVEWPGRMQKNPWAKAFQWSRSHTPRDTIFAIDPNYARLPAEETYGFRALAERSLLAENHEDPGAATVFPDLAPEWQEQVHAQMGIETFSREQFHQLKSRYGVSWVVLPAAALVPLECPYVNWAAQVCRVE